MNQPSIRSTHKLIGVGIRAIAIFILFLSLFINPWASSYYRSSALNYADVMFNYFVCSLLTGTLLLALSTIFDKVCSDRIINFSILVTTFSLLILLDRFILVVTGLPYWIPDTEIHYRHRPNVIREWKDYDGQYIPFKTNSHGHYDDEFSESKPPEEFRGLMIGDSVTMGSGVKIKDAFPNKLEVILQKYGKHYETVQIINAGVEGYSTAQELQVLKESLRFKPDFIAIGFCMNDIAHPIVIDKKIGGIGRFSEMSQFSNPLLAFFHNETGYGRLWWYIQKNSMIKKELVLHEMYDVKKSTATSETDPLFKLGWDQVKKI